MVIKEEILNQENEFITICKNHMVKYLYAFGSSTNNKFDFQKSDIDLLVEIEDPDPIERGKKLISLWDTFEQFFQRKVDLLTYSSIRNPYLRNNIDSTKILLYDKEITEIVERKRVENEKVEKRNSIVGKKYSSSNFKYFQS